MNKHYLAALKLLLVAATAQFAVAQKNDDGVPRDQAPAEAKAIGRQHPAALAKPDDNIRRHAKQENVRSGINDKFLEPDLDIREWLERFEVESREVFAARRDVVRAIGLSAGDRVADIGAGTGFFSRAFAKSVGPDGWVYAVEVSPRFLEHIVSQAKQAGLVNLTAVLCPQNTISLPPNSIDVAFLCDTYHHFEYPQASLASIRRALKPEGTLIVIDFERVAGKSRDFILTHVRAGKDIFRQEIEAAGFRLADEIAIDGFRENYFLRFQSAKVEPQ